MDVTLKTTSFGGYDKKAVEKYIDELTAEHEKEVADLKANVLKLSETVKNLHTMREVNLNESSSTIENLKKVNDELQVEVTQLRDKMAAYETREEESASRYESISRTLLEARESADTLTKQTQKECDELRATTEAECDRQTQETSDACRQMSEETTAELFSSIAVFTVSALSVSFWEADWMAVFASVAALAASLEIFFAVPASFAPAEADFFAAFTSFARVSTVFAEPCSDNFFTSLAMSLRSAVREPVNALSPGSVFS